MPCYCHPPGCRTGAGTPAGAELVAPRLISLGVGAVAVGVGITIKAMVGGSRKRLNDLSERLLYLEERMARSRQIED
jgi:hypothetical protein